MITLEQIHKETFSWLSELKFIQQETRFFLGHLEQSKSRIIEQDKSDFIQALKGKLEDIQSDAENLYVSLASEEKTIKEAILRNDSDTVEALKEKFRNQQETMFNLHQRFKGSKQSIYDFYDEVSMTKDDNK